MNNAKFFATSAHLPLAEEIAQILGISLGKRTLKKFSCGEIYINYDETVRGQDVFLVTTIRPQYVHEDFFELFLMCDAARRSFAKSVHVIVPHFGYSRQDKIHSARESISMKLCADLLTQSGADHVITLNLHADQSQAFF
jgi:ribose-phosphate pyrophosphokinase